MPAQPRPSLPRRVARAVAGAGGVHRPERRRGQRHEQLRMRPDRCRDTFHAAAGPRGEQVPHVALVLARTRRAHRRPSVAAADVGDAVRFPLGVIAGEHLTGARVDRGGGAAQPDRFRAIPASGLLIGESVPVPGRQPIDHLGHRGRRQLDPVHHRHHTGQHRCQHTTNRRAASCGVEGCRGCLHAMLPGAHRARHGLLTRCAVQGNQTRATGLDVRAVQTSPSRTRGNSSWPLLG